MISSLRQVLPIQLSGGKTFKISKILKTNPAIGLLHYNILNILAVFFLHPTLEVLRALQGHAWFFQCYLYIMEVGMFPIQAFFIASRLTRNLDQGFVFDMKNLQC